MQGYAGVGGVSGFGLVLFGTNDLHLEVFGCQAIDSVLPQVSRKGEGVEHPDHYSDYKPASQLPNSLVPS